VTLSLHAITAGRGGVLDYRKYREVAEPACSNSREERSVKLQKTTGGVLSLHVATAGEGGLSKYRLQRREDITLSWLFGL
jgi:hypothetical protein